MKLIYSCTHSLLPIIVIFLILGCQAHNNHYHNNNQDEVIGVIPLRQQNLPLKNYNNQIHQIHSSIKLNTKRIFNYEGNKKIQESPYQQYIVKFKKHPRRIFHLKKLRKSLIPLTKTHTYVIRASAKQIESFRDDIEWIGPYETSFKSNINFENLQRKAHTRKLKNKADTVSTAEKNGTEHFMTLQVIIAHDFDTVNNNLEFREIQNIADELNKVISDMDFMTKNVDYESVIVRSKKKLSINISLYVINDITKILKEHPAVHWIEIKKENELLNRHANQIIQGHNSESSLFGDQGAWNQIWEKGITGKGEIIGCSDTGIDSDNCLFRDEAVDVPFDTFNPKHRKIVYYENYSNERADKKDEVGGHGTHVVGSIAGSVSKNSNNYEKLRDYNGIAPDAKIYFTDVYRSGSYSLSIPSDLYSDLFQKAYENGVRIHSNSWGCSSIFSCSYDCNCTLKFSYPGLGDAGDQVSNEDCINNIGARCCEYCNIYDSQAQDIDEFTYDHDDMVILIAAGNDGSASREGNVGSPATSKNAITVGASSSTNAGFSDSANYEDISSFIDDYGFYYDISNEEECCAYTGTHEEIIKSSCCRSYMKQVYRNNPHIYNETNLAYFSSRGPADGGFIKPDVVSVGYKVISAHSDGTLNSNQCGTMPPSGDNAAALINKAGTSMATPVTAGGLGLIRQYVRGVLQIDKPSGALLKAMLLHSAVPLTGMVSLDANESNNVKLDLKSSKTPNSLQGYGVASLATVLKFSDSNFNLFVRDRQKLDSKSQDQSYCFYVNYESIKSPFFGITISWYDQATSTTALPHLVIDFDLRVDIYDVNTNLLVSFTGNIEKANDLSFDHENPVEKVFLRDAANYLKKGYKISVTVSGSSSNEVDEQFSLVATYPLDIEPIDCERDIKNITKCESGYIGLNCQYPLCFNIPSYQSDLVCSGHGECVAPDHCDCEKGYNGTDCSQATYDCTWDENKVSGTPAPDIQSELVHDESFGLNNSISFNVEVTKHSKINYEHLVFIEPRGTKKDECQSINSSEIELLKRKENYCYIKYQSSPVTIKDLLSHQYVKTEYKDDYVKLTVPIRVMFLNRDGEHNNGYCSKVSYFNEQIIHVKRESHHIKKPDLDQSKEIQYIDFDYYQKSVGVTTQGNLNVSFVIEAHNSTIDEFSVHRTYAQHLDYYISNWYLLEDRKDKSIYHATMTSLQKRNNFTSRVDFQYKVTDKLTGNSYTLLSTYYIHYRVSDQPDPINATMQIRHSVLDSNWQEKSRFILGETIYNLVETQQFISNYELDVINAYLCCYVGSDHKEPNYDPENGEYGCEFYQNGMDVWIQLIKNHQTNALDTVIHESSQLPESKMNAEAFSFTPEEYIFTDPSDKERICYIHVVGKLNPSQDIQTNVIPSKNHDTSVKSTRQNPQQNNRSSSQPQSNTIQTFRIQRKAVENSTLDSVVKEQSLASTTQSISYVLLLSIALFLFQLLL